MKIFKYICAFSLISILFVSVNNVHAAECVTLNKNIPNMSLIKPQDKQIVIDILTKEGFTVGSTKQDLMKAIRQFQKKYNLTITGTLNLKTRLQFNSLISVQCALSVNQSNSTTTATSTTPAVPVVIADPAKLEIIVPKGGETVEQGYGRELTVLWNIKNLSADKTVFIDLLSENMDLVAKTWKASNTGKFVVSVDDVDDLPVGWFYIRIRYMCNSESIPCAETISDSTFVIYPPTGYFASFFHFDKFKSGEVYDVTGSQPVTVQWYPYTKDFDYYRVYLGNVVLGTEFLITSTQSTGQVIQLTDVKKIKKDMKKTEQEIQNTYYIKVQAIKRGRGNVQDKVLKEITTAQFGIR